MIAMVLAGLMMAAGAAPGPTEQASPDDCAVFVEIGKAKLGWSAASAPKYAFAETNKLDNGGSYVEACAWKSLGVAEPKVASGDLSNSFSISRPAYGPHGTHALAILGVSTKPDLVTLSFCSLRKKDGHWGVISCDKGPPN